MPASTELKRTIIESMHELKRVILIQLVRALSQLKRAVIEIQFKRAIIELISSNNLILC
jgi:hypothetical protein